MYPTGWSSLTSALTSPVERAAADLRACAEAADLKRNVRWAAGKEFEGEWIVIPIEDFDKVRAVLSRPGVRAAREAAGKDT